MSTYTHTDPLHQRLQFLQWYLQGDPDPDPEAQAKLRARFGATVDTRRGLVTMDTTRGPASFHLVDLATIAAAAARRAGVAKPAPVVRPVLASPPKPAAAPVDDLHELLALLNCSGEGLHRTTATRYGVARFGVEDVAQLAKAAREYFSGRTLSYSGPAPIPAAPPVRAIGNFTSTEAKARTIAAAEHNYAEALRSGNRSLVKVMREALERSRIATIVVETPAAK